LIAWCEDAQPRIFLLRAPKTSTISRDRFAETLVVDEPARDGWWSVLRGPGPLSVASTSMVTGQRPKIPGSGALWGNVSVTPRSLFHRSHWAHGGNRLCSYIPRFDRGNGIAHVAGNMVSPDSAPGGAARRDRGLRGLIYRKWLKRPTATCDLSLGSPEQRTILTLLAVRPWRRERPGSLWEVGEPKPEFFLFDLENGTIAPDCGFKTRG